MNDRTSIDCLQRLGFTGLEARVYTQLLANGALTGYKVSKQIGKAPANVYQALRALEEKGAVLSQEMGAGETRVFRAEPSLEVLGRISGDFDKALEAAEESLDQIQTVQTEPGVYRVNEFTSVLDRARHIIDGAQDVLLLDIFPGPLVELKSNIVDAVDRGVRIGMQAYAPSDISLSSADIFALGRNREAVLKIWPGEQLGVVADASSFVTGLLNCQQERVISACWSDDPYLACLKHDHLAESLAAHAAAPHLKSKKSDPAIMAARSLSIVRFKTAGIEKLQIMAADAASPEE